MDHSEHKYVALQDVELFSWKKKKNLYEAPTRKNFSSGFLADRVKEFGVQGPGSKKIIATYVTLWSVFKYKKYFPYMCCQDELERERAKKMDDILEPRRRAD